MIDKIIMLDSPEAAQYKTDLKGWVSANGVYFGDDHTAEMAARLDGCTHIKCDSCGEIAKKLYNKRCMRCRELEYIAEYKAMPKIEWDGKTMLYSDLLDQYYSSLAEAAEDLEDSQTLDDLRLIICEPNYVRPLGIDYIYDDLADEDDDIPDEVAAAIKAFNEAVAGIVLSWSPGNVALELSDVKKSALIKKISS